MSFMEILSWILLVIYLTIYGFINIIGIILSLARDLLGAL